MFRSRRTSAAAAAVAVAAAVDSSPSELPLQLSDLRVGARNVSGTPAAAVAHSDIAQARSSPPTEIASYQSPHSGDLDRTSAESDSASDAASEDAKSKASGNAEADTAGCGRADGGSGAEHVCTGADTNGSSFGAGLQPRWSGPNVESHTAANVADSDDRPPLLWLDRFVHAPFPEELLRTAVQTAERNVRTARHSYVHERVHSRLVDAHFLPVITPHQKRMRAVVKLRSALVHLHHASASCTDRGWHAAMTRQEAHAAMSPAHSGGAPHSHRRLGSSHVQRCPLLPHAIRPLCLVVFFFISDESSYTFVVFRSGRHRSRHSRSATASSR